MKKLPRLLYVLLSLTWGLPLTLFGGIIFAALLISGKQPKRFGYCYYIEVGKSWGGLEGGLFFITCEKPSLSLLRHEHGHGVQNIIFGPLMLPLVTIPSAIRWHYRSYIARRNPARYKKLPPYGSIWFESMADNFGKAIDNADC